MCSVACVCGLYCTLEAGHGEEGVGLFWAWPDQAKPIWGFLDFNVHQPATGHNLYFGPDFFGFDILGGNGVHGGVQASPNSKYMGVRKL